MSLAAEPKILETAELYAASLHGDREAFAEIVRRHQNMVTAVTFSVTCNLQQSEDLAQETFIAAWKSLAELREPAKLPAWLCGMARNLSRKWLRKTEAERRARCETPVEEIADTVLADEPDRDEQAALLWSTIQNIPEKYREPLVMYYRQEQSVTEIAAALELSEDNVRQRIARGRACLKEEVRRRVESALEQLKPNPAFTVAVMAALPSVTLLGASTVLAETTSAIAGSSSVGKGSLAGIGIGGLLVFLWALAVALCVSIAGTVDGYKMMLNNIRNSPGIRSRRLTLLTDLWRMIVICFFIAVIGVLLSIPATKITPWGRGACLALAVGLCTLHAYVVANLFHKFWCRAVKEDLGLLPLPTLPLNKSWLSDRSLHCLFAGSLVMVGVVILVFHFAFVPFVLHSADSVARRPIPWWVGVFTPCFSTALFFFTAIPFALFYRKAIKLVSEKCLADDPPLVSDFLDVPENSSNLLDIFLGLSKKPGNEKEWATRRRLELMIAVILLLIPSFLLVKSVFYFSNPWPGYASIIVPSIVILLMARFATGQSAFRPIGWMLACFFTAGFEAWLAWGVLGTKGMLPMSSPLMSFAIAMQLLYGVVAGLSIFQKAKTDNEPDA